MGTARGEVGWLIVRVTAGVGLAFFHGYQKVFLGGASGLVTRYAAAAVAFTMAVALYSQRNDPIHRMELAVLYLAPMVAAALIGGGRYSLDAWIRLRLPIERRGS